MIEIMRSLAKTFLTSFIIAISSISTSYAIVETKYPFHYPRLYAGVSVGYGQTTWSELCTKDEIVKVSAPVASNDFGTIWGFFAGYQFGTHFAIETSYSRYPNTRILLDQYTFYYPLTGFTSHTQVFSAVGKFILPLANSRINAFLDAGVGLVHRNDVLAKVTRVGPSFGLGFMSNASRRVIAELGFEYYAGYAKSNHLPAKDFVPFVYGIYLRLGYRII